MEPPIKRKILVCVANRCTHCDLSTRQQDIPKDCPNAILHVLDTSRLIGLMAYAERDRQTGKTRELVGFANELASSGHLVYYIAPTIRMADDAKRNHGGRNDVKFMGMGQVNRHMRGMAPGYVIADDITADECKKVRAFLYGTGHVILAHYWTPRP